MKICIIGDGLTSLVLAESLTTKDIFVDLYLKKGRNLKKTARTIGISNENAKFLNTLFPEIYSIANKVNKIEIFNDDKLNILNFHNDSSILFYMLKYNEILNLIKKKILKNKKIKIISKIKNVENSDQFLKKYNLIIDTNITNNFAKKNFSKRINKNYFSFAYTGIIKHENIKNNIASQTFTKKGPLAFLPLNSVTTSIVYSIYDNKNQVLDEKDLKKLITNYNFRYKINTFQKFEKFKLNLKLLRQYYYKNVLAFGDKLHQIHPLAGQGFNMSLRDIKLLNKLIDGTISLGLPLDSSFLKNFQNTARYKNTLFATGIDFIYEFFIFEKKFPKFFSKKLFSTLNKNEKFIKYISRLANKGI